MGIAAVIGAEVGAEAGIAGGIAEAGFAGAEATFAGGAAEGAFAGAEGAFAGGAAEAGALGADAAFAGGAAAGLGTELGVDSSVAGALGAESGVSPDALSDASVGEFSDTGFSGAGSDALGDAGLSGIGGEDALLTGQGFDEAGFSDFGAGNVEDFNLSGESADFGAGTQDNVLGSPDYELVESNTSTVGNQTGESQIANQGTPSEEFKINDQPNGAQQGQAGQQAASARGAGGAGQFNPGQLLSALRQLAGGPSRPAGLATAGGIAGTIQNQGQALLDAYNSGQLSAPMMANLKATLQSNLSKLRQQFRSAGTFNSSMRVQAENQVFLQATASMANALQQELQQGLAALGQAGNMFLAQARQESANDQAFNSSLGNALGSILRMPFGGGSGGLGSGGGQQIADSGGGDQTFNDENVSEAA